MKKLLLMSLCMLILFNLVAFERFHSEKHYPNVLIVAFDANAINTQIGEINVVSNSRGVPQIGIQSFDTIANTYHFTDIERMFWVKDQDWQDKNGVYPMNIFKITLNDNNVIEDALQALSTDNSVIFAEFEAINTLDYIPNDPDLGRQWHLPIIDAPELWNYIKGDTTIVVAIVDNGTKWNHVDLKANIHVFWDNIGDGSIDWDNGIIHVESGGGGNPNPNENIWGDVIGWNFYPPQNNQSFQSFAGMTHGTHVAGIAGAVGDNGLFGSGVAMNIRIMPTRHGPDFGHSNQVTNPYHGIFYAANRGAHVINCSWGGEGNGSLANTAVDYALSQGSVVVASAGNNRRSNDITPYFPTNAINAISVASSNQNDVKAGHSNWGSQVAVAAPGQAIFASSFSGSLQNATDIYEAMTGTSMAGPVVAGVVAMMRAANPHFLPEDIKPRLMATADPMEDNEPGGQYEGLLGGGRVNVFKAVMSEYLPRLSIDGEIIVEEYEGDGDGIPNIGEIISVKINLYNEMGWTAARNTTATLTTDVPGIEPINPILEYSSYIDPGSVASQTNYALFRIDRTVNIVEIPFILTIESNHEASNPYPYTSETPITIKVSMSKANWPLILNSESPSSPMVTDLDGTGRRMVAYANGYLHVVDYQKNYNPGFPLLIGGNIPSDFAIGNVSRNSYQQIVLLTTTGRLVVVSHSGEIVNDVDLSTTIRSIPIIADLNNDGYNEIIVVTQNGNLFVFNGNDLSVWDNFPVSLGTNILSNIAVGDVNGDGIQNIVINFMAGQNQGVHVINPMTGQNIAGFPTSGDGATFLGATLANLSGGSGLNIIFGGTVNTDCPITILNSDGTIFKQTTISGSVRTEIAVNDLFRDGVPYLIFGDSAGNIWVKDSNLENISGFPLSVGARFESSPVFADIDNDGTREIIFGDETGRIHIIRPNGQYINGYPLQISNSSIKRSPWVGNFEPGKGDILVTLFNGIDYIDTKMKINNPVWNTFRGNLGKTASFADLRTPEGEIIVPIFVDRLEQNYPNPFNPETTISFSIKNDDFVRLSIYNIRGQLVNTILSEQLFAGQHSVIWQGNDNHGRNVSSGLYFYRIETSSFHDVKRMVLLK